MTMMTAANGIRIVTGKVEGEQFFPNYWTITATFYLIIPFNSKSLQKTVLAVSVDDDDTKGQMNQYWV